MNGNGYLFRLGSTSYVYRGDLLHNVEKLAGQVQDIELILFDLDSGESNLPSHATVQRMADLAAAHDLTYTVHLPLDLRYTPGVHHVSLRKAEQVIGLTQALHPYAYVFHLDGTGAEESNWASQARKAIETLIDLVKRPALLALENLESYAPERLEPIFAVLPIVRALDIGHLWKAGRNPLPTLDAWLPRTRVIHLHGMAAQDHQSLTVMPPAQLDPIIARLVDWRGVLTLEVFEADFFSSRQALWESIARLRDA